MEFYVSSYIALTAPDPRFGLRSRVAVSWMKNIGTKAIRCMARKLISLAVINGLLKSVPAMKKAAAFIFIHTVDGDDKFRSM